MADQDEQETEEQSQNEDGGIQLLDPSSFKFDPEISAMFAGFAESRAGNDDEEKTEEEPDEGDEEEDEESES